MVGLGNVDNTADIFTEANSVAVYDGGLTLGVGNESAADGTIRVKDGNLEFRVGGSWEKMALQSQVAALIPFTYDNTWNYTGTVQTWNV